MINIIACTLARVRVVSLLGVGVLVGAALIIIIPEGMHMFIHAQELQVTVRSIIETVLILTIACSESMRTALLEDRLNNRALTPRQDHTSTITVTIMALRTTSGS